MLRFAVRSRRFIASCGHAFRAFSVIYEVIIGKPASAFTVLPEIVIRLSSMLKVTTKEAESSLTFVLEGRLCRPWTAEAERGWTKLVSSAGNKKLLLDLAGVTFVDQDGEALLASMMQKGTKVRAQGVLVSHLVAQVQKRMQRKSRRFSRSTPRPRRDPGVP
jgi:anti-anti-sigma regulatory factor